MPEKGISSGSQQVVKTRQDSHRAGVPRDEDVPKIATSSDGSVQVVVMILLADMVVLHHTLAADAALPPGYEK